MAGMQLSDISKLNTLQAEILLPSTMRVKANTLYFKLDKDLILRNNQKLNTGFMLSKKEASTSQNSIESPGDKISIFTWSTQYRWNDYFSSPSANLIKFDYHQGLPGFAGARENDDYQYKPNRI